MLQQKRSPDQPDNLKSADGQTGDALPLADRPWRKRFRLGARRRCDMSSVIHLFKGMFMGQVFWISGAAVAVALVIGTNIVAEQGHGEEYIAFSDAIAAPEIGTAELDVGDSGSALAAAAFGLSALQPETFNSEIVREIIEASPLEYGEKDRLTAKLIAAQAGRAELPRVLQDIRVSLAVE